MATKKAELDVRRENAEMLVRVWVERQRAEQAEKRLVDFFKQSWDVLEPGTPYIHGWYIDAICEHLEAVAKRQIRKLLINISPRSSKSTLVSVAFPAWMWVTQPERKFLCASYDLKLSKRDSRRCRMLIKSPWYQKRWAERFKISKDQDEKFRFENDKQGFRLATSVEGGTTGEGGDLRVFDDPNNIKEMGSETYRETVIDWYTQVMGTRFTAWDSEIVIQQRCHEDDLTGHLLRSGENWDHLVIPMEYDGKKKATSIGWSDPRTEMYELMCPARLDRLKVDEMKRTLGPIGSAGQLQQTPTPGEGAKFKRTWWRFYNTAKDLRELPEESARTVKIRIPGQDPFEVAPVLAPAAFEQVVQGWDMTFKEERDNDLVSGQAWGRVGSNVYLLARRTGHWDFPETKRQVRRLSQEFPCPEKLIENKANGPAIIQSLRNEIPGLIESPIDAGLLALATSLTGYAEAGNCYLPNPNLYPWVLDIIEQFAVFPRGKHDDDVAAACHAMRRLFEAISNSAAPEFRVVPHLGDPKTACHVKQDADLAEECPAHWRRWIAVAPGERGAAIWVCETPAGSLRVYRELPLEGVDAFEAGRRIGEASLSDIRGYMKAVHLQARWNMDVCLEKIAFTPIEPVGSYAELLEQGILSYKPNEGSWEQRQTVEHEIRLAKFSAQMVELEDSAWDRLRDLLRFAPPDFEELDYDRSKAFALARRDIENYQRYMAAVEGRIEGEWPKIKFAESCRNTIAALGASRRGEDIGDPFLRALLIGVSAPRTVKEQKPITIGPWNPRSRQNQKSRFSRVG